MPTKNPRVNITFDPAVMKVVETLAKKENLSVSSVARELILEALDRREDMALSAIAKIRDVEKVKKVKHDDAW